jgi:cysteine synthase
MSAIIHRDYSGCIGSTPIIELHDSIIPSGKRMFLKMECANPNFSIKDRTALGMVRKAMERGQLSKGGTLVEATSGNLGKSFSMFGAIYDFRVIIVVDPKVSRSALNWFRAFGAEVVLVDQPDASGGFQVARRNRVQKLLLEHPGAYWPNQYDNTDNVLYHMTDTGPEVVEAVRATGADAVVGCVSTGGHMSGIGRAIKNAGLSTRVIATDVAGSSVFGGPFSPYLLNGVGLSWRAQNTDLSAFDEFVIGTDIQAISLCRLVARNHGLLLGGSSGLVLFAAMVALRKSNVSSILAVLPDSGVNYLDQFYDDAWLADRQLMVKSRDQIADDAMATEIQKPRATRRPTSNLRAGSRRRRAVSA